MAPKKEKAPPPSSKPAKSGGGKQKKKKWSKGKQKEKVNNMVLFDQATYDKLLVEAPKYKLVTPSILSDRMRISGSLARRAIKDLMARGAIRMISSHSNFLALEQAIIGYGYIKPFCFCQCRVVAHACRKEDEHQLIVKGLPHVSLMSYVEVIGIAESDQSIRAETWTNFGNTFDTQSYNQVCQLANGEFKGLFL
ncbi:hypothetical protein CMV_003849 [Castanea mollissima]|uniref:40S ribosomal protein S25 n=1 Tax=Castanea mollissima TaxID=60419 RepID=A0A8J4VVV6_9ROSI|nr:hypothetical protein CMV_003849 [Castanea mollissima]